MVSIFQMVKPEKQKEAATCQKKLISTETPFISYGIEIITIIFLSFMRFSFMFSTVRIFEISVLLLYYEIAYLLSFSGDVFFAVSSKCSLSPGKEIPSVIWYCYWALLYLYLVRAFSSQTRFEWSFGCFLFSVNMWPSLTTDFISKLLTHLNLKWARFFLCVTKTENFESWSNKCKLIYATLFSKHYISLCEAFFSLFHLFHSRTFWNHHFDIFARKNSFDNL